MCGFDNSKTNSQLRDWTPKPYLYFVNPFDSSAAQICVSECPTTAIKITNKDNTICQNNTKPQDTTQFTQLVISQQCAGFVYASSPILYRCLPSNFTQAVEFVKNTAPGTLTDAFANIVGAQSLAQQIVGDFMRTWIWFLIFAGVAAVVAFAWIVLLQLAAGLFVWCVIGLALIVLNG